jgi:hypothetical protein
VVAESTGAGLIGQSTGNLKSAPDCAIGAPAVTIVTAVDMATNDGSRAFGWNDRDRQVPYNAPLAP